MRKREKEAMDYLVKKYCEDREQAEKRRIKLESMDRFERLLYEGSAWTKGKLSSFKELVVRPVGLTITILFSTYGIVLLATSAMYKTAQEINRYVPYPLNYPAIFIVANAIIFSPFITSFELYARREKKREKEMLKEYGIEVK
jgi:uncharacterized membrane protein